MIIFNPFFLKIYAFFLLSFPLSYSFSQQKLKTSDLSTV